MSDNLQIYDAVRSVPDNAKRTIQGGKLKGKTDINPMHRIKTLTEQFGPCGIGWWYTIEKEWTEPGAEGTVAAFADINLYYKLDGAMSVPIPGTGGSMLVDLEKGKLVTNDEAFKMALTDAISVACKAIGVAADVYWEADTTKYDRPQGEGAKPPQPEPCICERCKKPITGIKTKKKKYTVAEIVDNAKKTYNMTLCWDCMCTLKAEKAAQREIDAYGEMYMHEDAGDRV